MARSKKNKTPAPPQPVQPVSMEAKPRDSNAPVDMSIPEVLQEGFSILQRETSPTMVTAVDGNTIVVFNRGYRALYIPGRREDGGRPWFSAFLPPQRGLESKNAGFRTNGLEHDIQIDVASLELFGACDRPIVPVYLPREDYFEDPRIRSPIGIRIVTRSAKDLEAIQAILKARVADMRKAGAEALKEMEKLSLEDKTATQKEEEEENIPSLDQTLEAAEAYLEELRKDKEPDEPVVVESVEN